MSDKRRKGFDEKQKAQKDAEERYGTEEDSDLEVRFVKNGKRPPGGSGGWFRGYSRNGGHDEYKRVPKGKK